jgi:hypothetical protein
LNSRLLRYFLPSIFLIYLITLIPYVLFFSRGSTDNFAVWLLMSPFMIYFILLILSLIEIAFRHNVKVAFWALVYFPLTHSYYALSFLKGFYSIKQLESKLR